MAPILKEFEAPVGTTSSATPAAPQAKSPNETPTRPQPVALEIPVTVNGARTVEGSDKREPFSETTHTVLVFPQGAVIRIATPLVPGQLVFVTNEKSKKEIVCQVVKSKSGGTTSGYVELQFTEPAAGFWGLLLPGTTAASAAARPATPVSPAIPKPTLPASPVAAKPVAPKPLAPAPPFVAPVRPVVTPPPPPLAQPLPAQSKEPVEAAPKPPEFQAIKVVPPPPPAPPQADAPVVPLAAIAPSPAIPSPVLHNYSKEISALFDVPQGPVSKPASTAAPAPNPASSPSTDELKLHAARLQEQLSSLLFTETAKAPPVIPKEAPPVAEGAKKVFEIAFEQPKPVVKSEPKPAAPARIPVAKPLAEDEEVKIPAWLAPISQNLEPLIAEPAASNAAATDSSPEVPVNSEESYNALAGAEQRQPQTNLFGGESLGDASAQTEEVAATGSRKGLFLGLAAAALLLAGGGAWYFRQHLFSSTAATPIMPARAPSSQAPKEVKPAADLPAAGAVSTPAVNTLNPAPANANASSASLLPSKNSSPTPTKAVFNPAPEPRDSTPAPRNVTPVEPPKKPAVGDVHLAAPVVNRASNTQQPGDALPAIDTNIAPVGADPLAAVGSAHHKQPVAPLPVGGDVKPAHLIKSIPPIYPLLAKNQRISGDVQIDAFVDTSGNVAEAKIISGPALLHHAALDAVKQWKYSPALLNGQPTSMHLTVTVQFRTQ